jgi:branched-chain amino acid transport system permease protein
MIDTACVRDWLKAHAPLLLGGLILAALPILGGAYAQRVFTLAGIYALTVIGYQLIFGHAGAFSLAQGAFFGLGAYAAGIAAVHFGWAFPLTFAVAIAAPLAVATLVAIPVLRLESHYFALATLVLAESAWLIGTNWTDVTGGANGLAGVPPIAVAGWTVARGWPLLLFVWSLVAIGGALAFLLTRGFAGLRYRLVRERPLAAASVGIDGGRLRTLAFIASAGYAGAAGALFAHSLGVVSPDTLAFPVMVSCLTMAVIGGRARIAGAILGAVLLIHLPEWLRGLEAYYLIAYGAVALLVVIAAPDGIIGTIERFGPKRTVATPGTVVRPRMPAPQADNSPRKSETPILSLESVSKSFGGVRAIDGVSLAVMRGEILGLIGPNGSGKTTLVNLLTGLYRADSGRIGFEDHDITERLAFDIARLGMSRSFQAPELIEEASLLDNVAAGGRAEPLPLSSALSIDDRRLSAARAQARDMLDHFGMAARANDAARTLGPAFRRRAEIARALMSRPSLLVLDEPSAGSSSEEAAELAAILSALAKNGVTLLVIDHNLPFLARFATRLACLEVGRLIADGAPALVRAHPRVIEAYLGPPHGAA